MANNYEEDQLHYLLAGSRCSTQTMLDVCETLGVPVAMKAQWQSSHSRASPLAMTQIWLAEFNSINMTDFCQRKNHKPLTFCFLNKIHLQPAWLFAAAHLVWSVMIYGVQMMAFSFIIVMICLTVCLARSLHLLLQKIYAVVQQSCSFKKHSWCIYIMLSY